MEATLQSPLGQTVLEPGVVTIGSTPDSRLVVHDARVSPHHAVVRPTEQGYTITDRLKTRVLRDPFSNKPFVMFYATKRVGGRVINSEAIKLLKIAA